LFIEHDAIDKIKVTKTTFPQEKGIFFLGFNRVAKLIEIKFIIL
jgi:hypothetical protein